MTLRNTQIEERSLENIFKMLEAKREELEKELMDTHEKIAKNTAYCDQIIDFIYLKDERNRVILNNGKNTQVEVSEDGAFTYYVKYDVYAKNAFAKEYLRPIDKLDILQEFERRGDLLSSKLINLANEVGWSSVAGRDLNSVLQNTDIPQKLLTRSMKEKEYDDYLDGIIPVSSCQSSINGEKTFYYIPQEKKEIEKPVKISGLKRLVSYVLQKGK